ncbi:MAG: FAD:protein FMN transferase [Bifidobacteriaceae bacterium]|jgi:thiamine biosynthesis lipoprotein ApbE|nr:FAD:protein FMN transferase [Bifidobacteriaceae bacterium]
MAPGLWHKAEFPGMGTQVRLEFAGPRWPGGSGREDGRGVVASEARAAGQSAASQDWAAGLVGSVRELVREIEAELSRYRGDSDVSRLNRASGQWLEIGQHTAAVLAAAAAWRIATGGLFDPAMPGQPIDVDTPPGQPPRARIGRPAGAKTVHQRESALSGIDLKGIDSGIDLGGIGKGYTADQILALCQRHGASSALVSLGTSSLAALGERPGGGPWRIGLRSPGADRDQALGVAELAGGALATSGIDEQGHHIIDPRTGRPAKAGVLQATVMAADGMTAEAYSTALVVGGPTGAWPSAPTGAAGPDRDGFTVSGAAVAWILVTAEAVLVSPGATSCFHPSLRE